MIVILFKNKNGTDGVAAVLEGRADISDTLKYLNKTLGGEWCTGDEVPVFHAVRTDGNKIIEL